MTRLQIELPDEVAMEVKRRAEDSGLSVTSFVIGLVEREIGKGWPKPLRRPAVVDLRRVSWTGWERLYVLR